MAKKGSCCRAARTGQTMVGRGVAPKGYHSYYCHIAKDFRMALESVIENNDEEAYIRLNKMLP